MAAAAEVEDQALDAPEAIWGGADLERVEVSRVFEEEGSGVEY